MNYLMFGFFCVLTLISAAACAVAIRARRESIAQMDSRAKEYAQMLIAFRARDRHRVLRQLRRNEPRIYARVLKHLEKFKSSCSTPES